MSKNQNTNKIFVLDTSVILHDNDVINSFKEHSVAIPITVLEELDTFKKGNADILLGTQIISKWLDFSKVSLVGIITADIGLFIPDFRSGEKTFQTIYQMIGRSGRRDKLSKAIIQSYNTDDFYIKSACNLDVGGTYEKILKEREELNYPPFSRLIRILFLGKKENLSKQKSREFYSILKKK